MSEIAIAAENIEKHYGKVVALAGVSLEVPPGTVLGLLGPNGAGKTTAVRILTTNLRPDAGRATVLGFDVVTNPQAVRERIGLAGQSAAVDDNLTGRENLRLVGYLTHQPRKHAGARADELLEQFGLERRGEPYGEDVLGRHAPAARPRGIARPSAAGSSSSTSRRRASTRRVALTSGV